MPPAMVVAVAALTLLGAACGDEEPPGPTMSERLSTVAGRTLTAAEVEEQLALGATLCRMDESVLDAVWYRLDDNQLEFQDVVFGWICPERSTLYAGRTGRFVTDEAKTSGVATSTTRAVTTPATALSTTARATIAPAPSGSSPESGGTDTTGPPADSTSIGIDASTSSTAGTAPPTRASSTTAVQTTAVQTTAAQTTAAQTTAAQTTAAQTSG